MSEKDRSITDLLERLRRDLGEGTFDIVDRWDGDLRATGVARPGDHRYLVYICTFGHEDGTLHFQCERPGASDAVPADSDAMVEVATYEDLPEAARSHLLPVR